MWLMRLFLFACHLLLVACGPKSPIKPDGDFVAINPYPESVGSFAKHPPAEHFEYAFNGDLIEALSVLQKLQPQLSLRPVKGSPYPVHIDADLKNVTLAEVLTKLHDDAHKEATLDFNPSVKKGRPFAQVIYFRK